MNETTLLHALDAHAAKNPDAPAVDGVSYGDLRAASLRVAAEFGRRGIAGGERIALYAENSLAFVYAYLGALRAGAVAVPANVLYRESDLAQVLDDSGARAVAVSEASRATLASVAHPLLLDLAEIAHWATDAKASRAEVAAPPPAQLALLIYTSGTTGRAKGALLSHGNLAAIARQVNEAWRWTAADTLLLTLPLFHVHGLGAGLNGTLSAGGHVLIRERFDAAAVARALRVGEASMFFGVPTMYVRLLEEPGDEPFARVRLFVSGSAALPPSVHEAFTRRYGASILERYGATEFGFALTNRYAGPRYPGTVGFPFPGVEVRLVDESGADVAPGGVGEILVAGPNVCGGYWRNPEATAAAFAVDAAGRRWYRSGDLATFDPERGYAICGRKKELIITGGFNVYPLEVEDELLRVPGIRASAVVGRTDPARGEVPVAFVEADAEVDLEAVRAALGVKLASFKIPKALYRIDALPRNAMGKVDKPLLRRTLEER